jgi:hypothetical protein
VCVEMSSTTPHTFSKADGTFDMPCSYTTGDYYLVVQKGAFRRIRSYHFDKSVKDQPVDQALTTMPGKMDQANGDSIPKMAVITGQWDAIDVTLAKLGLGTVKSGGILGPTVTNPQFTIYSSATKLLNNPAELAKYHVVFIPCSYSNGTTCDSYPGGFNAIAQNLKSWVEKGGRLYATDYAYEFIRQSLPGYIDWAGESAAMGSACQTGSYTKPAIVQDQGLKDWLAAQAINSFQVQANWTTINAVNSQQSVDPDGNPITVTPKVWVEADKTDGPHPCTVSFEHVCGRGLFSTYHTEASLSGTKLLAQERALLYIILEVSVCIETTPE